MFLAPHLKWVYGLVEENGHQIIKVKGLNSKSLSNINITDLKALLIKDSNMEFNQDKWFKHMEKGEITINNQIYTLKVTANKRKLIYHNNRLITTIPYNINENKDILTPLSRRLFNYKNLKVKLWLIEIITSYFYKVQFLINLTFYIKGKI